jgi:hypothetical protein
MEQYAVDFRGEQIPGEWLSDSFGEINGAIPSSFVDSAFMVRMGVPEPIEMQGIHHRL